MADGDSFDPPKFTYEGGNVEILDGYAITKVETKGSLTLTSKWDGADVDDGPAQVDGWVNGKPQKVTTPDWDKQALGIRLNPLETLHVQVNGSREPFAANVLTQRDVYMSSASTNKVATQVFGEAEAIAVADNYDFSAA